MPGAAQYCLVPNYRFINAVLADYRFINAVLAELQFYQRYACRFTGLSTLCLLNYRFIKDVLAELQVYQQELYADDNNKARTFFRDTLANRFMLSHAGSSRFSNTT